MNNKAIGSSCSAESSDSSAGSQRALPPDVIPARGLVKPVFLSWNYLLGVGGDWRVVPGQMRKSTDLTKHGAGCSLAGSGRQPG